MKLFTVHDKKAEAFLAPFVAKSVGDAARMFETECKNNDSMFSKFPSDFTLISLGSWDERTGLILSESHVIIANASEYAPKSI